MTANDCEHSIKNTRLNVDSRLKALSDDEVMIVGSDLLTSLFRCFLFSV